MLGADTFRMKLNTVKGERSVPQAHDRTIVSLGSNLEAIWKALAVNSEAVIAGRLEPVGNPQ